MDILGILTQHAADGGVSRIKYCEKDGNTYLVSESIDGNFDDTLYIFPSQVIKNLNKVLRKREDGVAIEAFWEIIQHYKIGHFEPL